MIEHITIGALVVGCAAGLLALLYLYTKARGLAPVQLLSIEHRHGVDHWICASEQIAMALLDEYVQRWWEHEIEDQPMPEEPSQRVRRYFEAMDERDERGEWYSIVPHIVQYEVQKCAK